MENDSLLTEVLKRFPNKKNSSSKRALMTIPKTGGTETSSFPMKVWTHIFYYLGFETKQQFFFLNKTWNIIMKSNYFTKIIFNHQIFIYHIYIDIPHEQKSRIAHRLHFQCSSKLFSKCFEEFKIGNNWKFTTYEEQFYDSIDFKLIKNNIWFKKQDKNFSVKYKLTNDLDKCSLSFSEDTYLHFIPAIERVFELFKSTLELKCFCKFQVLRLTKNFSQFNSSINVDCVKFSETNQIYYLGTVNSNNLSPQILSGISESLNSKLETPSRSKIIEWLYRFKNDIFCELVQLEIIPKELSNARIGDIQYEFGRLKSFYQGVNKIGKNEKFALIFVPPLMNDPVCEFYDSYAAAVDHIPKSIFYYLTQVGREQEFDAPGKKKSKGVAKMLGSERSFVLNAS